MSLYGDYISERENFWIEENEHGFITFIVKGDECYIRDVYVRPDSRKSGVAAKLADRVSVIAKSRGATTLLGSIWMRANNTTESMKALIAYGFKLESINGEMIFLRKEI